MKALTILLATLGVWASTASAEGPHIGQPAAKVCNGQGECHHVNSPKRCLSPADRHSAKAHKRWTKKLRRGTSIPAKAKRRHAHQVRCAKSPAHRKAMRKQWRTLKRSLVEPLPANHDLWLRIGRCEQPGSGYGGVNWSHPGPTYQGGLGFYNATWDGWKPAGYPADAGSATWRQQMIVANRVAASVGFTAWGCYGG